jgi:hypothetical protein
MRRLLLVALGVVTSLSAQYPPETWRRPYGGARTCSPPQSAVRGGYERNNGHYYFSSQVLFPRGYNAITGANLTKLSTSYALPLLYPDWAMGNFLYVKRMSANAFYDYGKVEERQYRSTGMELLFDLNVLHFPETLRAGVRYAYRLDYHNARVRPFLAYSW